MNKLIKEVLVSKSARNTAALTAFAAIITGTMTPWQA
jgi:hypothetical protein